MQRLRILSLPSAGLSLPFCLQTQAATALTSAVCAPPVAPVDMSVPNVVVGTGTAASCTETALANAIAKGGKITFNCGGAATIYINSQKKLRSDIDTTIDGKGLITLDGQNKTRILFYSGPNWQKTARRITIQNITFRNAKSTGPAIPYAPAPCSQGTDVDGGGAAIFARDGILRVFNSQFITNKAPSIGPDVAGGGIYAVGMMETTVVGSVFSGNTGANGAAIGSLFGNLKVYNSRFTDNIATGSGANSISTSTCSYAGGQVGNGGNGGAISIDGAEIFSVQVCGSSFQRNKSGVNAFGGALFRTVNTSRQPTQITKSTFDSNVASKGGGALYIHNSSLKIEATTLSNNSSTGAGGGIFVDGSALTFINSTFFKNISTKGVGGAMASFGNTGSLTNLTFAGNQASGGPGYFGAAIFGDNLTVRNTLFANNTTNDCGSPMACRAPGSSGSPNLQWPNKHLICTNPDPLCTSGTQFKDPLLPTALAYNGGPTATLKPAAGSPAYNTGTSCPATDQRGVARPPSACTQGAVQ